jgi:hypothetical protein
MWALLLIPLVSVSGLSFYLTEGQEKCFLIDMPEQTVVIVQYQLIDRPPPEAADQGVNLQIFDPLTTSLVTRLVRSDGKVSYTSQMRGSHRLCLTPTSTSWFGATKKIRFNLGIDNTMEEVTHDHLASKEQIDHLEEVTKVVTDRINEIIKAQEYGRQKEALFKDESEDINSRVMWFTIFQTLVILVSGVWQIFSLRRFFISRKLL